MLSALTVIGALVGDLPWCWSTRASALGRWKNEPTSLVMCPTPISLSLEETILVDGKVSEDERFYYASQWELIRWRFQPP
jgi:hypothetical protein